MKRILTSTVIALFFATAVVAQTADQVVKTRTENLGAARMCFSDAGSIQSFGPFMGQSNDVSPDTIYLCLGDTLFVNHANDEDLSGDPNTATPAGIGYAFYNCPPTVTGEMATDIAGDPCTFDDGNAQNGFYIYTGGTLSGDVPFFNQGDLQTTFNGGNPILFHFAPATFDALFMGVLAEYEGNPAGECVNVRTDQQFAVAYLNEVVIDNVTLDGCQGEFMVTGGLPELTGVNYSSITIVNTANPGITGTVTSSNNGHGDVVTFDVSEPGTYAINVEDGKSCGGIAFTPAIAACNGVTIGLPFTNVLPSSNECIPVTVSNFNDLISAQFTVEWDPSILSISDVQGFNPALVDLTIGSFGWENFPSPNSIAPGVLTVSWSDNSFVGVDLPNGATMFEICFDVVGQLGDCSPLEITQTPVPFEVINSAGEEVQLLPDEGKAIVSDNAFFVLLEQDSLTCPSFDDGSFTVTVDEGTAPYSFVWNTIPPTPPNNGPFVIGANGGSFTVNNLPAGSYQVTVTDNNVPQQTVIDTVDVLAGPLLGITIRDTVPSCFGFEDGSIYFIPTSDGLPVENPGPEYTFNWSVPNGVANPGNTFFIENVPAGSYGITVTDPAGCEAVALIPLGQPPALRVLDANTFIEDASCTGGADGMITITASGGTTADGNYTFEWNPGPTVETSTATLVNLDPGTYCVTVTDDNGCFTEECYTVGAVKVLSLVENITNLDCFGDTDGAIFVTGNTTGAPADLPYTFTWGPNAPVPTNTNTTSEITGLAAGEYALTMTDASAAGCQVIDTFTVVQPDALDVQVLDFTNETCLVGSDGTITLGVTGGTAPYTYAWSHDATLMDSIAIGLPAGVYTIDVTDNNMCTQQIMQTISAPDPPVVIELDDSSVTCADDTDGTLTVDAQPAPGTSIVSFEWSNMDSGPTINGLAPGEYIVTITADNACTVVDTALVTAPDPVILDSVQVRRPSCPGEIDGQISVFASGGTPPYSYDWSHLGAPTTNNPVTGLGPGDYTLTIIDANGCTSTASLITIVDAPTIEAVFTDLMDTSCPNSSTCDGQATVTASYSDGSPGDFVFTWESGELTNGGTISTATMLCAGTQTVTINDGCGAVVEFTIGEPEGFNPDNVVSDVSCNGLSDGSITVIPAGGTAPYDLFWIETGETTATINNLMAGQYNVIITDANNCTFQYGVPVDEPDVLTLSIDPTTTTDQVTCEGDMDGVIGVIATGGNFDINSPYQFNWSDLATGEINTELTAGTYSVTVTDVEGCSDELTFTITEPDPIVFTLDSIVPPLCFGDPTLVMIDTVFGGANNAFEEYTFMVDNNGLSFPVIQPATVFAGDHIITVEDVNGCTEEQIINIASPGQIMIDIASPITVELGDSTVQLNPLVTPGGTYSYQWTPAEFLSSDTIRNPFVFPGNSLEYTLTVINENGCTAVETVFVELDANRNVYIPNIFSPNNDGRNDDFRVFACLGVREIRSARLFDRWGGLMVEQTGLVPACTNGTVLWDGTQGGTGMGDSGQLLNPGVYVYMIEIEFLDGVILTYRGDVTLIR